MEMEKCSDEECPSDSEEGIPTVHSCVEEYVETFGSYEMSRSKFPSSVVVRKYDSKGLSFQLWPAANAVCWYLENEFGEEGMCIPALVSDEENLLPALFSSERVHLAGVPEDNSPSGSLGGCYYRPAKNRRMKVLELGSGTGMVGIVAACLGAHVILTDLPHVLPNAEYNMEMNRKVIEAAGGFVDSRILRWGVEEDVKSLGNLSSFDLILASDVVYYDSLFKPLLQTLKWLVGAADHDPVSSEKRKNQQQSNDAKTRTVSPQVCVTHSPISIPLACYPGNNQCALGVGRKSASFSARAERRVQKNVPLNKDRAKAPVIYIGHVRRWKKDNHFFKQASKVFDVGVVHRYLPQDNARVGPIIYRLNVKPTCLTDFATS